MYIKKDPLKKKISLNFSKAAPTYNNYNFLQTEAAENLLAYLKSQTLSPKYIIDLGCGTGIITKKLASALPNSKILGIDIAADMIKHANKTLAHKKQITFNLGDAEYLSIENQSIDLVFSNLMLQWCSDLEKSISEVWRVLKNGGSFIFSITGDGSLKEINEVRTKVYGQCNTQKYVDINLLLDKLTKNKFTVLHFKAATHIRLFNTLRELMQELKKIGANTLVTPETKGLLGKQKFKALQNEYERHRDINQKLPLSYTIYYAHATK